MYLLCVVPDLTIPTPLVDSYVTYPESKSTERAVLILPDVLGHEFINAQL